MATGQTIFEQPFQIRGGNVFVTLSMKENDRLLLRGSTLVKYDWFAVRLKDDSTWAKGTPRFTDDHTGKEILVHEYALKLVPDQDGNSRSRIHIHILTSGKYEEIKESRLQIHMFLSEHAVGFVSMPLGLGSDETVSIKSIAIASWKVLFRIMEAQSVNLSNISVRAFNLILANSVAYAEYLMVLPSVAGRLRQLYESQPETAINVQECPGFHVALSTKLRSQKIFTLAARQMIQTHSLCQEKHYLWELLPKDDSKILLALLEYRQSVFARTQRIEKGIIDCSSDGSPTTGHPFPQSMVGQSCLNDNDLLSHIISAFFLQWFAIEKTKSTDAERFLMKVPVTTYPNPSCYHDEVVYMWRMHRIATCILLADREMRHEILESFIPERICGILDIHHPERRKSIREQADEKLLNVIKKAAIFIRNTLLPPPSFSKWFSQGRFFGSQLFEDRYDKPEESIEDFFNDFWKHINAPIGSHEQNSEAAAGLELLDPSLGLFVHEQKPELMFSNNMIVEYRHLPWAFKMPFPSPCYANWLPPPSDEEFTRILTVLGYNQENEPQDNDADESSESESGE